MGPRGWIHLVLAGAFSLMSLAAFWAQQVEASRTCMLAGMLWAATLPPRRD